MLSCDCNVEEIRNCRGLEQVRMGRGTEMSTGK